MNNINPPRKIKFFGFDIGFLDLHDLHSFVCFLFSIVFIIMLLEQIIKRVIHQYLDEKDQKEYKKPRKYSKSYCEKTSCKDMGFTQKASCRPYKNCYK